MDNVTMQDCKSYYVGPEPEGGKSDPDVQLDGLSETQLHTQYTIMRYIGRGGFGKVFLVKDKSTAGLFAMKVIKKSNLTYEDGFGMSVLENEMNVFTISKNSPFLIQLLTFQETAAHFFFIMEYVGAGDLHQYLHLKSKLSEEEACFYMSEICCGIDYLHTAGFMHCDIKCSNILLDFNGHIKIADYGSCIRGSCIDTVAGTVPYRAPEIYADDPYDWRIDWWSAGIVLYEMLTGYTPFDIMGHERSNNSGLQSGGTPIPSSRKYRILGQIQDAPLEFPGHVSEVAEEIVRGLLEKDPKKRLGTAGGMQEIRCQLFFKRVHWEEIEKGTAVPPVITHVKGRIPDDFISF